MTNKMASQQQTSDKQTTTIEQYKQINNNNNITNNIPTPTTNRQSLFEYVEQNFGRTLNGIEIEELSSWEDNELTRYVIKKAVLSNIYSFRYVSKILYTYKQKGIKTVVEAEKEYQKFEKERNSKSNKKEYKNSLERFKNVLDNIPDDD